MPGLGPIAVAAAALLSAGSAPEAPKDLYFGEALYHAYQEDYFEALRRLDTEIAQHHGVDEPQLDSLQPYIDHAEFSVGDFELSYRMHHRAGRAIRAVLEADVPEAVRNEAAFRLARLHFQKNQPKDAVDALGRIRGQVPELIRDEIEFLRANVYMGLGRASDAVEVLRGIRDSDELIGFTAYNLGIALLQEGRTEEAIRQLERAGRVDAGDGATRAIRDRSNLVLGTLLLESAKFGPAQRSFGRVRLEGPFSNQALLRNGWADASAENFERALVPWSLLAKREATDAAVQEALLALPYAYSKLDVHGRAALLYEQAARSYGQELEKVDASIESVRQGTFLEALVREEIRRDEEWVIRLRSLPDAPETFYLIALMASHEFQTALQNYLDLEDLRNRLLGWQTSLDAFEDVIRLRRAFYEPRLPEIDRRFRNLDAQIRLGLEKRVHLERRLEQLLVSPRPESLATTEEQRLRSRLDRLAARLRKAGDPGTTGPGPSIERLRGVLTWRLETRYYQRLTESHRHLRELNRHVEALTTRYEAFVRTRQAAVHGYVGYEVPIQRLRTRVGEALERLATLKAAQGHALETVAIRELEGRRERLAAYQNQARFAFADSYDRAAKAQAR